MRYFAFGSCIESEYDLGPLPLVEDGPVAVTLTFSTATKLAVPPIKKLHSYLAQARNINIYADGQELCLQVEDFIQFYFDWKRQVISCFMTQYAGKLLIYYWILQQALPIYLLLSNRVELLHAGAVVMDGSVVGFLAESGTGKSTLVEHFLSHGHSFCTDEHLVLPRGGKGMVAPSIPYYRPNRNVEDLGVRVSEFSSVQRPLRALYLLRAAPPDDAVRTCALQGSAAASVLFGHSLYNLANQKLPAYRPVLRKRFEELSQLSAEVPIKILHVPRSLARLPEVYGCICEDLKEVLH
jgi:hypothetical protein